MKDRLLLFLIKILLKILLREGGEEMVWRDIYVKLIIAKRRTIDKIKDPALKQLVLEDLKELGFDGYGNPLPELAEE